MKMYLFYFNELLWYSWFIRQQVAAVYKSYIHSEIKYSNKFIVWRTWLLQYVSEWAITDACTHSHAHILTHNLSG